MEEEYGSDFITISDEDGTEYELEVLMNFEFEGGSYLAVVPAGSDEDEAEDADLEVSLLKKVMEDGEEILCAIEDDEELEKVYQYMMDHLYDEEDDDE